MARSQLVVRAGTCYWQPKTKRKRITIRKTQFQFGSISPVFLIVGFLALMGIFYLYTVNASAVKGYQIRQIEKEISELKKQNEGLRIKEAELKSLYYIEESTKDMNMDELKNISYVEEKSPFALK